MDIEQKLIDSVSFKLNKQNAIFAALGAAIWSIPTLALWFLAYTYNPDFGVMMFLLSGSIIGLAVRFHGKGMKRLFSFIAFVTYTWLAVIAFSVDIVLHDTTWAAFLFGMYAAGAGISMYLAKKEVPFEEHRAHTHLTSLQNHQSDKAKRNKWFVAMPILLICVTGASYVAAIGVLIAQESQQLSKIADRELALKQKEKNKEIDVNPKGLAPRKTEEILRYSYAYYSGLLFDKSGTYTQPYPRSEFKAKTILNYLVDSRNDARAMYILGILSEGTISHSLIKQASDSGDKYAQIYFNVKYGCHTDAISAMDLLNKQQRLSREQHIKDEISSILYIGFPEICSDFEKPEYIPSYMLNYSSET